jgi:hypothetical protein
MPSTIGLEIENKVFTEIRKGFDSADERREVFLDIADHYNVSPDIVWTAFFKLTTLFDQGVMND